MVEADFVLKKNDTTPQVVMSLMEEDGSDIDLTGATVRFHMTPYGSSTEKVDTTASILNAEKGIVQYTWIAGDTDTTGWYRAEFEVTYGTGEVESFPNSQDLVIQIVDEVS